MGMSRPTLYTVGHSNRQLAAFLELLAAHGVDKLVDVRTIPRSRHNPQFDRETLSASLKRAGTDYEHLPALGGLRHPSKESANLGWRNASFRGYADYMQTTEFERGLEQLEEIARDKQTAIMCAEAIPWRCHRSLIADALSVRGWLVLHIQSRRSAPPHELTPFLRVSGGVLTYPKAASGTDPEGAPGSLPSC